MLGPTHLAGSYLALSVARPVYEPEPKNETVNKWLMLLGLVLSVGIDVDALWVSPNHHMSLLHYPLFWIGVFVAINILGVLFKSPVLSAVAIVVLISTLTHLFLDTFGVTMGIFWLWPFSMEEFSFLPLHPIFDNWLDWFKYYITHPIMVLEIAIVLLALLKWTRDRSKFKSARVHT